MREPRYPEFRYPPAERRRKPEVGYITALMWGVLVVVVIAMAQVALLWWIR